MEGRFIRKIAAGGMILKGIFLILLALSFYFVLNKKILNEPTGEPTPTSSAVGQIDPPATAPSSSDDNLPLPPTDPLGDIAQSIASVVKQAQSGGGFSFPRLPSSDETEKKSNDPPVNTNPIATSSISTISTVFTPDPPAADAAAGEKVIFNYDLRPGYSDPYVKILQRYLNKWGFFVAKRGYGSPGQETVFFGKATQSALIKFQEAHRDKLLDPFGYEHATGHLAGATKDYVNNLAGQDEFAAIMFDHDLRPGHTDADVKILQQYLNKWGFFVARTGPGSPGRENSYFGKTTQNALIKFQEAHRDKLLDPFGYERATGHLAGATKDYINKVIAETSFDR